MKVYCCVCGKQVVSWFRPRRDDPKVTTSQNGRYSGRPNEIYCGYCADEMDENGLFPEERA